MLLLYVLYAAVARSRLDILSNILLAAILFGVLLLLYAKGMLGGGDVKLIGVVALWVGVHCALLFSLLLLVLISFHVMAFKFGWTPTKSMENRQAIPYAPAIAGALIGTLILGCT